MEIFENDIKNCLSVLEKGGTFLYPTDTIWGLGCDATNSISIDKISEAKNRPENKSYLVLVANMQMLKGYLENPIADLESILAQQEGATTMIYSDIKGMAKNSLAHDGSLGIRIPQDDFCQELLTRFGKPIISTSANLSGEPTPAYYQEISETVKNRVDYICDWRRTDIAPKEPSKIIKLNADGSILKIR